MGFSGNGMVSIRNNHGMLSTRGARFQKSRKYINVDVDKIQVDMGRMDRIAKDARKSSTLKLIAVIVILSMVFGTITLL